MRVLVIGGSKGLGLAMAQSLTNTGCKVECRSRSSVPALDLEWNGDGIREACAEAIKELGGLDTLVISSGMGAYMSPTVSDEEVKKMYQTNVFGPMTVFRACQKALLKTKGKAMVITSTCSRRPGSGGLSVYGSAKAALNSWVLNEGRRQAKHGIALCSVSPGWFDSKMTVELKPKIREAAEKAIPFGRFGTAFEVADFACNILEQSNWCLAGQIFECSGGA